MTETVRYQKGSLYREHGAWFIRFRERVRQENGSVRLVRKTVRLGSVEDFPTKAEVEPLRADFMQKINAGHLDPHPGLTLAAFTTQFYLPWVRDELRASTHKGYREICERYVLERVGQLRLRSFRTVDASRMLRAVAGDCDLTRTTLQHIKSVLSGIFTHAKNQGAFDGVNPVTDAKIPGCAREPGETYAYNLAQIQRILAVLPLLPRAVVATASFAGLREGELCGLEWPDYGSNSLTVSRSIWKGIVNPPKTRASRKAVPVIAALATILDTYRGSMHNPPAGVMFHHGGGERMDVDKLAQRVIRPAVEAIGFPWYGWHGFRRGIASNLFALGVDEKVVQRILRHAKPHVTKERYIKAFDPAVLEAMRRMQTAVERLASWPATGQQEN